MKKRVLIYSLIILFLDQLTKMLIVNYLKDSITIIRNFFYFSYVENTGAAWGLFNNYTILLVLITLVALYIIYRYSQSFIVNKRNTIAFSLLYGGIVGNLIDRIWYGYVRDFIDFKIFGYNFPVFNIADMAICFAVFLLIIAIIRKEDTNGSKSKRK